MLAVNGCLNIVVDASYDMELDRTVKGFIQSRLDGYNDLSIRFDFSQMFIQKIHETRYGGTYKIIIPFNAYIEDSFFDSEDEAAYDIEYLLASRLRDVIPGKYDGISNLRVIDRYGNIIIDDDEYMSVPLPHYANDDYDCDYGNNYDYECSNSDTERYELKHVTKLENKFVIEKKSNARKLFILQNEGD